MDRLECGVSALRVVVGFSETEVETKGQRNDGDDEDNDEQSPPLELPRAPGRLDTLIQLCVCVLSIFVDLNGLVLDLDGLLFLVNNLLIKLLEQCCQLNHGFLDTLDVIVTSANCTQDTGRLATAVALELWRLLAYARGSDIVEYSQLV